MTCLDLLPGKVGVALLEAAADLAPAAQPRRLLRPAAAAGGAWLEMVVACEAEHQQVAFRIVAAAENAQPVVHIELALRARDTAYLAAPATSKNQLSTSRRRELGRAGAAIVRLTKALAQRRPGQQRGAITLLG